MTVTEKFLRYLRPVLWLLFIMLCWNTLRHKKNREQQPATFIQEGTAPGDVYVGFDFMKAVCRL